MAVAPPEIRDAAAFVRAATQPRPSSEISMSQHQDTIFALSSGALPSGVAVIRVSGQGARTALDVLCGHVPAARRAHLMEIRNGDGEVLDQGLVLFFAGPASFTGEDCAELQVHGGKAVVKAILTCLAGLPGFRHAAAGEFSRRAFENGKMDLVEVEGLADLVRAETEMQRKLARYMSEGHMSKRYHDWMDRLSRYRALIEAELDFADEGDVPGSVSDQVWKDLSKLEVEMAATIGNRSAELIRDGFRIAIAGPPNAGKSSLLNYLAKRDIAIVTDVAGTTRDVLEAELDIGGHKVCFFDTAGIRETSDEIELIGISRARTAVLNADAVLYLTDSDQGPVNAMLGLETSGTVLTVRTKSDIGSPAAITSAINCDISVSTVTGDGIDSLMKRITSLVEDALHGGAFDQSLLIRHRNNLELSLDAVRSAMEGDAMPLEVRSEYLRLSAEHLGRITGAVSADELLGLIFSEFCIGK